jgi:hypothetical protein
VTDPTKGLEAELASLRPTALSPRVVDAIAQELADAGGAPAPAPPLRFADRCLLGVMGAGSLAACVIIGLVTWQIIAGAAQPELSSPQQILAVQSPPAPAQPAASPPAATIGQYLQLLARSSSSDVVPEIFR